MNYSAKIELFDDGQTFFRQRRSPILFKNAEVVRVRRHQLPRFEDPFGAGTKLARDRLSSNSSTNSKCHDDTYGGFMELVSNLYKSDCYPAEFFRNAHIVTTLSALRSVVCQWTDSSKKVMYFKKNPHYCQMVNGKLHLHTFSSYTCPVISSPSRIHLFNLTGGNKTLEEFNNECYFGLAKMTLRNGIRIVYTYRIDAIYRDDLINVQMTDLSKFESNIDYFFLTAHLAKKRIRQYNKRGNISSFGYQFDEFKMWSLMYSNTQRTIENTFNRDLSSFLNHLLDLVDDSLYEENTVFELEHVFYNFKIEPNRLLIKSLIMK